MRWRAMTNKDLEDVAQLARAIYIDYPENIAIFEACLRLYPAGCHILEAATGDSIGYLIAHPAVLDSPPTLDLPLVALPEWPDCYFVHDLALSLSARGRGLAVAATEIIITDARRAGFEAVGLVAVGNAHGFWAGHGFAERDYGDVDSAMGYGAEARLLVRRL